ncbi:hypothetical protein [Flavobacterium alkalisoli]|uniref:hypothetical protein n=1 Tax=Flavobacterium alkalisoli TaxID=2602769 RepID=UPI003A937F9B
MKIIYAAAALLLPGIFFAQDFSVDASYKQGRTSDCFGRGMCQTSFGNTLTGTTSVTAYKINETSFGLQIKRESLSQDDEISIAGKAFKEFTNDTPPVFLMPEALLIDATSLQNLGLNKDYNVIPTGEYDIFLTEETVTIVFVLAMR